VVVRGYIPIEPGYSWFTTKTILVVLFKMKKCIKVLG